MSLRKVLASGAKLNPPGWMSDNLCYETMMGSVAYGVSSDTSDTDVYGICVPPKHMVFPHLAGEIHGFGTQIKRFETWQEHHIAAQGDEALLKRHLVHCLEMHYGDLSAAVVEPDEALRLLRQIAELTKNYR